MLTRDALGAGGAGASCQFKEIDPPHRLTGRPGFVVLGATLSVSLRMAASASSTSSDNTAYEVDFF